MMRALTFDFDVQLNDNEDWIAKGTKVQMSDNEFHLNRYKDSVPVIITEAYTYKGRRIKIDPTVEWFDKHSFKELR